jgi:hypothetical protein
MFDSLCFQCFPEEKKGKITITLVRRGDIPENSCLFSGEEITLFAPLLKFLRGVAIEEGRAASKRI